MKAWSRAVTPHEDIARGRVNEGLFDAKLGHVAQGAGPAEYRDVRLFYQKTCFTDGLRDLLTRVLRRVAGDEEQNGVLWLQTGFGGGKSHSELAAYHLLSHPDEAMSVPDVAALVRAAGLERPPAAKVAVIAGTSLNPLGRTTSDGIHIRTLLGEVAYQLGGADAFAIVAENEATPMSPGDQTLMQLLQHVGPCAILFDETLHYVDKARTEAGDKRLAEQTVAFMRELTDAVNATPGTIMVVSLTASREDMLSDGAMVWLERLNEHVLRGATPIRPVQRSEIHEVVRRRLFERVDEEQAAAAAREYRQLYASLGGLPAEKTGAEYERLMARSYPFHPELISVLYERWGSRTGFQETRDTLRFLALALQELWTRREECERGLIQPSDIDLGVGDLRGMARRVAGDEKWEAVIGTDVAAQPGSELAKAQLLDQQYQTRSLAQGLATTILLYSVGGGELPSATREGLRLACARPDVPESEWDDVLARLQRTLFYYYWEESRHQFRIQPNVLSLQYTHHTNLTAGEVEAHMRSITTSKALGDALPAHGFQVHFRPEDSLAVLDDEALKLIVLDSQYTVSDRAASEATEQACLAILSKRGDVLRQNRNTLVFCAADADAISQARQATEEYLSWSKIQRNSGEWDRIGGAQQTIVKERLESAAGAVVRGLISAYCWALLPTAAREGSTSVIRLSAVRLGHYGPGKLIVPLVWERLTSSAGAGQAILTELTPETLLDRYQEHTWPRAQLSVTTRELWERFCRQVALPLLSDQNVLLDTLRVGQHKGLFALGHLIDDNSPRDQRDSYSALYLKQTALPPQELPQIGQRWVLLRPNLYHEVTSQPTQVTVQEVMEAVREVNGPDQPARVSAIYAYVAKGRNVPLDDNSFHAAVRELVTPQELAYSVERDGLEENIPADLDELKSGWVSMAKPGDGADPEPPRGRVISVKGTLGSLQELTAMYKNLLQPLESQHPKSFRVVVSAAAEYDDDPGGGLTAALKDGQSSPQLIGLVTVTDSSDA